MESPNNAPAQGSSDAPIGRRRAETVTIGGKKYIAGLYWQVLNNRRAYKAEASVIGKRDQMELRALHLGAVMQAGFVAKSMGGEKGMISLALAVMAGLGESFLAIFELPDGRYALIGASDGALIPGCDFIGLREDVEHRATQKLSLFSDITKVIAPANFGLSGSTAIEIGSILGKVRIRQEAKLSPVTFEANSKTVLGVIAACAVFCLVVFGWIAWSRHEETVRLAAEQRAALISKQTIQTAQETAQREAYAKYLEHPWKAQPLAADFMNACHGQIDKLPLSLGGWMFTSAACIGTRVTLVYTRLAGGTMASIIAASKKDLHQVPQFDISNEKATLVSDMSLAPGGDEPVNSMVNGIPSFVSHWQSLGLSLALVEVPVKFPDAKTLPGQKSSKLPPPKPDWHAFDWTVSSLTNPVDLLSDVSPAGLRITSMTASFDSKQAILSWKTEGFLYVH